MTERLHPAALLAFLLTMTLPAPAVAQSPYAPVAPLRIGDYYLNTPSAQILPEHLWELRFTHRFSQPINHSNVHDLGGLDSPADVAIGLAWAPRKRLQLAFLRTNLLDDLELSGKYAIHEQSDSFPLSLTGRAGFDWRTQEKYDGARISPFVQLIATRQFGSRWQLFATPSWIVDDPLFNHAFNVPLGAAFALKPGLYAVVELIPENHDVAGTARSDIGWSVGLKRAFGGHFFDIVLSDSRATHVDQYISSAPLGGIRRSDIHLGFNIARRFGH